MRAEADSTPRVPELLAPAGGQDALRAAVNNGADAVYLGMRELNARRGAENFDLAAFGEACRYAHLRGARVYLTANVLVHDEEIGPALRLVASAWEAGADAVIVQDIGLLSEVRRTLPEVRLHASTQIDAHNLATVRALAGLGVSRVTLARETSLAEIARLASDGGVEVESFVHGALCFSYSGQCLLSSVAGGRSANRGLCAQPCRLPYTLAAPDGTSVAEGHLLSTRDLCGLEALPRLAAAGVSALKIEGRMKSPEYVALVTGVYRAALDRAVAGPDGFEVLPGEEAVLAEAFSRGFSTAYLDGIVDDRMMSVKRPNNRGVPVGRIASVSGHDAEVAFDRAVEAADTIEVWTGGGRFAQRLGTVTVAGAPARSVPAGARATVRLDGRASKGDRVVRVANAALLDAARRSFAAGASGSLVPVAVEVRLRAGEPLVVGLSAGGVTGRAEGAVVEPARTKPVTVAEVMEHVGRLGGTAFEAASWEVDLDPAAGIGFSALHAVRREAVAALEAALLAPWAARGAGAGAVPARRSRRACGGHPRLVAAVWSAEAAEACVSAGADEVLLDGHAGAVPAGAVLRLPRVAHDGEVAALLGRAREAGRAVSGNLGLLVEAVGAGVACDADWPLNVSNAETAAVMGSLGARRVWASPELSGRELAALVAASPVPVGALAYGRVEVMVAEHCVLSDAGACGGRGRACASCAHRSRGWWGLRDRRDFVFPVMTDPAGRSHIVNSVTLDLMRAVDELVATGVEAVRLEFTVESAGEATRVTAAYRAALDALAAGVPAPSAGPAAEATTGHFFRGVR